MHAFCTHTRHTHTYAKFNNTNTCFQSAVALKNRIIVLLIEKFIKRRCDLHDFLNAFNGIPIEISDQIPDSFWCVYVGAIFGTFEREIIPIRMRRHTKNDWLVAPTKRKFPLRMNRNLYFVHFQRQNNPLESILFSIFNMNRTKYLNSLENGKSKLHCNIFRGK